MSAGQNKSDVVLVLVVVVSKFEIRDVWLIQPCSMDGQSIKWLMMGDWWWIIDWQLINDGLMIDWWLMVDWMMIDRWLIDDWSMIDFWLIDDWLMIDWWLMNTDWLIDDWLMTD